MGRLSTAAHVVLYKLVQAVHDQLRDFGAKDANHCISMKASHEGLALPGQDRDQWPGCQMSVLAAQQPEWWRGHPPAGLGGQLDPAGAEHAALVVAVPAWSCCSSVPAVTEVPVEA